MDSDKGWELLRTGHYGEAIDFFLERLEEGEKDFTVFWGLAKAYLVTGQKNQARSNLQEALEDAVQAWDRGEIPYDLVEAIEKDMDRAAGDADQRILARGRDYLLGLLRRTGAMWLDEAVALVEKAANLRLSPLWESLLDELHQDERFRLSETEVIYSPEVVDPEYIIRIRQDNEIIVDCTLDDLVRALRNDYWGELEQELQPILDSISGGNLKSRKLIMVLLNSKTFREALDSIDVMTRIYDLRQVIEKWYKLLYQLWVRIPRWELGFRSLAETDNEDMWLGRLTPPEIGRILGLIVDEEGNFYCPDCGERVALSHIHEHQA